jgi:hypothetical protein
MYAHICICNVLLGDMTPCIWASVLFNQCMPIYAYVMYWLETWPHVSEQVFCLINVYTYMHMQCIAWRNNVSYCQETWPTCILGFDDCKCCMHTNCIWYILPGDMTHMYLRCDSVARKLPIQLPSCPLQIILVWVKLPILSPAILLPLDIPNLLQCD